MAFKTVMGKKPIKEHLPSHFPEDCIVLSFFIVGVGISSHAARRYPSLNACTWGFPQELAAIKANKNIFTSRISISVAKS